MSTPVETTKPRKQARVERPDEEEEKLAKLLFENEPNPAFFEDVDGEDAVSTSEDAAAWRDSDDDEEVNLNVGGRKRFRVDHDEKRVSASTYASRLRDRFTAMHGSKPAWARADADDGSEDDSDDEDFGFKAMLASSKSVFRKRGAWLSAYPVPPEDLHARRLGDLNNGNFCDGVVKAFKWHPSSELYLTGSYDKSLRVFRVGERKHTLVSSTQFERFPISDAIWCAHDSDKVLMCGPESKVLVYDVKTGQHVSQGRLLGRPEDRRYWDMSSRGALFTLSASGGSTLLCDSRTLKPVRTLKMSGACLNAGTVQWLSDSRMATGDNRGSVYQWDIGTGLCEKRVQNENVVKVLSMTQTADSLCMGTDSGVIDVMELADGEIGASVQRSMDNLVTGVTSLTACGELLVAASDRKTGALKAFHVPAGRCYANWPTREHAQAMGLISTVALSPDGSKLAIGNDRGRVLCYSVARPRAAKKAGTE